MKRNELVLLLAGLGLAGTTGCMEVSEKAQSGTRYVITGHPGGAYQPRNVNKYDLENSAKFVLFDKGAERSVTCPNIEERVTDEGRLEVVANVRNRLNRRIEVQINCVFKDDKGFPTRDGAALRRRPEVFADSRWRAGVAGWRGRLFRVMDAGDPSQEGVGFDFSEIKV